MAVKERRIRQNYMAIFTAAMICFVLEAIWYGVFMERWIAGVGSCSGWLMRTPSISPALWPPPGPRNMVLNFAPSINWPSIAASGFWAWWSWVRLWVDGRRARRPLASPDPRQIRHLPQQRLSPAADKTAASRSSHSPVAR
jgi:hypothetical protein